MREKATGACAAVLATFVAVALAHSTAESAEAQTCGAPPPPPDNLFTYTGSPQPFRVPSYASQLRIYAEGGHGGQFDRTAAGGVGGGIEAIVPVNPGECLLIYIGGFGSGDGGFGWGDGGDGGGVVGQGYDGASGGGSTALVRPPSDVLVAAGGGGGGGGDGYNPIGDNYGGGIGGNGGNPAGRGGDGDHATGGVGGDWLYGKDGADARTIFDVPCSTGLDVAPDIGGGGGGGGALDYVGEGGCAGTASETPDEASGGGGGGGGGWSKVGVPGGTLLQYYQSPHYCPYGNNLDCNGSMDIFQGNPPAAAAAAARRGPASLFPKVPTVRVRSLELAKVLGRGLPVGIGPIRPGKEVNRAQQPRLRIRLQHRCRKRWVTFEEGERRPSSKRATLVRLKLERDEKRRVRRCSVEPRHLHAELRLVSTYKGHKIRNHLHLYAQRRDRM